MQLPQIIWYEMELENLRQQLTDEKMLRSNYENAVRCLEYSIEKSQSAISDTKEASTRNKRLLNLFSCSKCSTIFKENKCLKKEIDSLKSEIDKLKETLAKNVDDCAKFFYEKETLSKEIEELTAALFDESNKMVAHEKKLRAELEKTNVQLSIELTAAMDSLKADLRKQVLKLSRSTVYNEASLGNVQLLKKSLILDYEDK